MRDSSMSIGILGICGRSRRSAGAPPPMEQALRPRHLAWRGGGHGLALKSHTGRLTWDTNL